LILFEHLKHHCHIQ